MNVGMADTTLQNAPQLCIEFAGQQFVPLPSGALFWPATQTLIVADLHLEKMSSFAARGSLLPPYDTGMTLKRLAADIAETAPERVICLGDSFHRDEGVKTLGKGDVAHLQKLAEQTSFLWLSGNHDPSPHTLPGYCARHYTEAGIFFTHEPQKTDLPVMAGHLHPAARVRINGRSARRSCFVYDTKLAILPSYGSSTGSLNILKPAFLRLLERSQMRVIMLGGHTLYPINPAHLVQG